MRICEDKIETFLPEHTAGGLDLAMMQDCASVGVRKGGIRGMYGGGG